MRRWGKSFKRDRAVVPYIQNQFYITVVSLSNTESQSPIALSISLQNSRFLKQIVLLLR
ncbi:hypothetical protein [Euhalothece natronophila]|uniref:hypothetical protein n=1 Tax=Euhalothece natronophila TaxID=577489 RepID=UPI001648A813|nr:hypothetical protein [Euhalothece natronophila]